MRFRPSGGLGQTPKTDHGALEARAEATGQKPADTVFDKNRHEQEIERAENAAAGLTPGQRPPAAEPTRDTLARLPRTPPRGSRTA